VKPLPLQAQLAPVFGLVCADLDEDGNLDVLLTGNSFSTEVMAGRYDAGYGLCLLGDGKATSPRTRRAASWWQGTPRDWPA
jgi:hypothetical protein